MKIINKKYLLIAFAIMLASFGVWFFLSKPAKQPDIILTEPIKTEDTQATNIENNNQSIATNTNSVEVKTPPKSENSSNSVLIKTPFLVQAPNANWDALHEDACEEASLIMIKNYLEKTKSIDTAFGDKEIQELVAYEESNSFGPSITLSDLNKIAQDYYGLTTGRVEVASIDKIKKEISNGKPVIIPAAGKKLPNPNFRNGGPNYHMLVVKGYDKNGFITNDPGTRKGEGFRYTYYDLFEAIHDWDPNNILNGTKNYLVFD